MILFVCRSDQQKETGRAEHLAFVDLKARGLPSELVARKQEERERQKREREQREEVWNACFYGFFVEGRNDHLSVLLCS